jgi:hypothetical protein
MTGNAALAGVLNVGAARAPATRAKAARSGCRISDSAVDIREPAGVGELAGRRHFRTLYPHAEKRLSKSAGGSSTSKSRLNSCALTI